MDRPKFGDCNGTKIKRKIAIRSRAIKSQEGKTAQKLIRGPKRLLAIGRKTTKSNGMVRIFLKSKLDFCGIGFHAILKNPKSMHVDGKHFLRAPHTPRSDLFPDVSFNCPARV